MNHSVVTAAAGPEGRVTGPGRRQGPSVGARGAALPVVVIGAGPYGLSIAAHLRARGVEVRVFGDPMASWTHHMPEGMFLKSVPSASAISAPGAGFTLDGFRSRQGLPALGSHDPVPIEQFVRYGRWFQEQLVPTVERVHVRRVGKYSGRFDIELESGEQLRAGSLVVATGLASFAHVPAELSAIAPEGPSATAPVSHSSQHRDLSTFAGSRVAVIGGGQSALETAALLHETGASVRVIVRKRQVIFAEPPCEGRRTRPLCKPPSPLGPGWSLYSLSKGPALVRHLPARARQHLVRTVLGPSGAWWLRERVEGRIEVQTARRVGSASLGRRGIVLHLAGPSGPCGEIAVDHVIAATGYRVDLDVLTFLDPLLRASLERVGGSPLLTASFESSIAGLYFAGLAAAATFGPVLRFVCGTGFTADRLSRAVADRTRHLARS